MFEQEIQRELRQQCRRDNENFRTTSESSEGMVAQPLGLLIFPVARANLAF
jgi:hypothetical protein